jgi:hypothetical protein
MRNDEHTVPMFFDDLEDALREIVRHAGGPKAVGAKLWPEIDPDKAGRRLMDCLNESRREILSPAQVMLLLRIGRQVGCHAAMNYLARECGYADPSPIEPEDEVARLQREFVEATKALGALADRIEHVQGRTVVGIRRSA